MLGKCRAIGVFLLTMFVCVCAQQEAQAIEVPTARELFAKLPVTIFENTPEGLSEEEKQELVERGDSTFWLLENENSDRLVLLSRPFGETRVLVKVFRGGPHNVVVVLGTSGTPVCALELWELDETGGLVPMQTPDEPDLHEFFRPNRDIPKDASPAVLFCVKDNGLEARPLFWGVDGLVDVQPDFRVEYEWKDGKFVKKILPVSPAASGSKP